jgi:hypothetical protein
LFWLKRNNNNSSKLFQALLLFIPYSFSYIINRTHNTSV